MSDTTTYQKCAAQHFGPWMVEPKWFAQAVSAVKAGTFQPTPDASDNPALAEDPNVVGEWVGDTYKVRYVVEPGAIARIPFMGQVVKGNSSFGGASSVFTRQSIRKALNDERVDSILLHIDSPGGTVSGTGDLADEVSAADSVKPVYTYFEDLGASAAYWIGSQARKVFANPTAQVGSIGTMTYVEDSSGAYDMAGIKVHLVSTGKFKGAWLDGLKVSDEYLATVQQEVNDLNEHFLSGVLEGRKGMTREQLMSVADGRVFIADKAKQLGLIDEVSTLDAAIAAIPMEIHSMNQEQFRAFAAEHPDDDAVKAVRFEGAKPAHADGAKSERDRVIAIIDASKGRWSIADKAIRAGMDADQVTLAVAAAEEAEANAKAETVKAEAAAKAAAEEQAKILAAKDAEIEKLKAEVGGQQAISTGATLPIEPEKTVDFTTITDPQARAEAEWEADLGGCKSGFVDKDAYVSFRKLEMAGRVRLTKTK